MESATHGKTTVSIEKNEDGFYPVAEVEVEDTTVLEVELTPANISEGGALSLQYETYMALDAALGKAGAGGIGDYRTFVNRGAAELFGSDYDDSE